MIVVLPGSGAAGILQSPEAMLVQVVVLRHAGNRAAKARRPIMHRAIGFKVYVALHNKLDAGAFGQYVALQHKPKLQDTREMTTTAKTPAKPKTKAAPKPRAKAAAAPATLSAKAQTVYVKGAEFASDVKSLTKANAYAIGAAGKILGAGLKQIGTEALAEGKVAVTTVKGDFAELKTIKSPTALVKLQSKVLGRNIGALTTFGIKHADEMIKLVEASAMPITHRFEATIKTFKKAA
jgi:hypothetical protein